MQLEVYQEAPCYKLLLKDGTTYDVTENEMEIFKQAYPKIDIEDEVRKMVAWCYSNTSQRKTKRGIKRFINGWLNRAKPKQNNGLMTQREYARTTSVQDELSDTSWAN